MALQNGISYKDFWDLTPKAMTFILKAKEEEMNNQMDMLWLQGLYIQYAYASTQTDKVKYPKVPFHREKENYNNGQITDAHALDLMRRYADIFNKKMEKKKLGGG